MEMMRGFLSLLAMLGLLSQLHPAAVPLLLITTAPRFVAQSHFAHRRFSLYTRRTSAQRMFSYLLDILQWRDGAKETRVFGIANLLLSRARRLWHEFFDEIKSLAFSRIRLESILVLLSTAGLALIWAYTVIQAVLGRLAIGYLVLVFQAAERSQNELSNVLFRAGQFYDHSLFLGHFFGFLDLTPDSVEGALDRRTQALEVPNPVRRGIELRDVSFRYPGSDTYVLRDLSFVLRPGETAALVGENGAGKTTLVKLLARLYDPTDGAILLDGTDVREYELDDYRRQIGVIFQDFVRYQLSVQDNIGFGQVEYVDDRERVMQAADKAGTRSMIDRLPEGVDTMLGKTFGTVDISGGEWQKIAPSRAFMRASQILILDEPLPLH